MLFLYILHFLNNTTFGTDLNPFEKVDQKIHQYVDQRIGDSRTIEMVAGLLINNPNQELVSESSTTKQCSHCPQEIHLTNSVNSILQKMADDKSINFEEKDFLDVKNLNLLFYEVKSKNIDGTDACSRYLDDPTTLLQPKHYQNAELILENFYKFSAISKLQFIDPAIDEIVYYYRDSKINSNTIVQAILTKNGGKFRYFKIKDDFNLPEFKNQLLKYENTSPNISNQKSEDTRIEIAPELETKLKVIPTNLNIANISTGQVRIADVIVKSDSKVSLTNTKMNVHLVDMDKDSILEIEIDSDSYTKKTTISIPYLFIMDKESGTNISGKIEKKDEVSNLFVDLKDHQGSLYESMISNDSNSSTKMYYLTKNILLSKDSQFSLTLGKNSNNRFKSFKYKKSLRDNVSIVLDVNANHLNQISFTYQLESKF